MEMPAPAEAPPPAINAEQRAGRGTVSAARQGQIAERARWLTEDINERDFEHAVLSDNLSDVTVHTSQDEESSDETEASGAPAEPSAVANTTMAANTTESATDLSTSDSCGASDDATWETSDHTFSPEETATSEDMTSEGTEASEESGEMPLLEFVGGSADSDMTMHEAEDQVLSEMGWEQQKIDSWRAECTAACAAMNRSSGIDGANGFETLPVGLDKTSGETPSVLLMIDDGSFKHLVGTSAMHLAVNRRDIEPYPVQSATGHIMVLG
jgi:hypothetical protein